jgi:hypothetical protein
MKKAIFTVAMTLQLSAIAAPELTQVLPGRYIGRVPYTGATCHIDIELSRGTIFRQLWLSVKGRDTRDETTHVAKLEKLRSKMGNNPYLNQWTIHDKIVSPGLLRCDINDTLEMKIVGNELREVRFEHTDGTCIKFGPSEGDFYVHCGELKKVD